MKYAILIYGNEAAFATATEEQMGAVMQAHTEFGKTYASKIVGGEALEPTATATSIRNDVVTDGPFVETKEALGGFYLVEAADLDEAIAIARHCPAAGGGVEVRPIWDTSAM